MLLSLLLTTYVQIFEQALAGGMQDPQEVRTCIVRLLQSLAHSPTVLISMKIIFWRTGVQNM